MYLTPVMNFDKNFDLQVIWEHPRR
jgi:hypothetical protein